MKRNLSVLLVAALVIALPFIFRQQPEEEQWTPGDPVLVVISPHNEAIRYEFGRAFNRWHIEHHGVPVKIDWRIIGGTSEIARYMEGETQAAFRAWWTGTMGHDWPQGGSFALTNHRFQAEGADPDILALYTALRETDDPTAFSTGLDLFFGGGEYDHSRAYAKGLTVNPWPEGVPEEVVSLETGQEVIPERLSGETWRAEGFMGTALSTFGIVYNHDRLADLGVEEPPLRWVDLTHPVYHRQLGVADPTKSGSVAKAFEMIIHQQINQAVEAAGFSWETEYGPQSDHPAYRAAIETGWLEGINLVRLIGANARYFTDSAGKVPIDVSTGNAAVGLAIDFYGRYQAETSRDPQTGEERMRYVTPVGGSSVSCDPISLVRGAPHRELAVRFIEFTVSVEGQRLWNYRPGTEGGPEKFALRRLPIRRDFYPSEDPEIQRRYESHAPHTSDDLSDDTVNPYHLASQFTYVPGWTGRHFGIHRNLIRAMCLDAGDELSEAWAAIARAGGPEGVPEAMEALMALPVGVTWSGVLDSERYSSANQMTYMREWVLFFREHYRLARELAEEKRDA
ncbi:MAG: ABC transporter substrate-binding protein [Kiritimatiellae bacterium]|jgi:iron(III) transport system substrate-binding protein|nr:ABC transporter substrate-binding protein [Kiritimatiellia bacterium]